MAGAFAFVSASTRNKSSPLDARTPSLRTAETFRWTTRTTLTSNCLAICDVASVEASSTTITSYGSEMDFIAAEYYETRGVVLALTGRNELLDGRPWLKESIRVRNRYSDSLNLIQVELLRRSFRNELDEAATEELRHLTRLSVNGIAAGMRTSGCVSTIAIGNRSRRCTEVHPARDLALPGVGRGSQAWVLECLSIRIFSECGV